MKKMIILGVVFTIFIMISTSVGGNIVKEKTTMEIKEKDALIEKIKDYKYVIKELTRADGCSLCSDAMDPPPKWPFPVICLLMAPAVLMAVINLYIASLICMITGSYAALLSAAITAESLIAVGEKFDCWWIPYLEWDPHSP